MASKLSSGDHTTFQSFPTDLHNALQPLLPARIELRSIVYPTYKTKRPIAVATQNFLSWLESLPAGQVILCGHSMGGLLAAEAATSATHTSSKRVIAVLAFDVPFLGMHPHVVISGIASLLPNKKGDSSDHGSDRDKLQGGGLKSEREMNDRRHVNVPPSANSPVVSPNASIPSFSPTGSSTSGPCSPSSPTLPPPLPPRPSSKSTASSLLPPRSPSPPPPLVAKTLSFLSSHANDPFVRFVTKHHSDPLHAAKRWVVESFEFGICMFDPKGLRNRYAALEAWRGEWVAFWTETVGNKGIPEGGNENGGDDKNGEEREREATESLGRLLEPTLSSSSIGLPDGEDTEAEVISEREGTASLSQPSLSPPDVESRGSSPPLTYGPPTKSEHKSIQKRDEHARKAHEKALRMKQDKELKALRKQHDKDKKRPSAHHFVVRPFRAPEGFSGAHRWERVEIKGAKDEVEAHCGLFLRDVNWEYDAFVRRVADVVMGWVGTL